MRIERTPCQFLSFFFYFFFSEIVSVFIGTPISAPVIISSSLSPVAMFPFQKAALETPHDAKFADRGRESHAEEKMGFFFSFLPPLGSFALELAFWLVLHYSIRDVGVW